MSFRWQLTTKKNEQRNRTHHKLLLLQLENAANIEKKVTWDWVMKLNSVKSRQVAYLCGSDDWDPSRNVFGEKWETRNKKRKKVIEKIISGETEQRNESSYGITKKSLNRFLLLIQRDESEVKSRWVVVPECVIFDFIPKEFHFNTFLLMFPFIFIFIPILY